MWKHYDTWKLFLWRVNRWKSVSCRRIDVLWCPGRGEDCTLSIDRITWPLVQKHGYVWVYWYETTGRETGPIKLDRFKSGRRTSEEIKSGRVLVDHSTDRQNHWLSIPEVVPKNRGSVPMIDPTNEIMECDRRTLCQRIPNTEISLYSLLR